MSTCRKFRIGRVGALIAILLAALVTAFALSSVTDAAAQLRFDEVPTGWSVTSGEADDHVGAIQASGLKKKNRIRYSLVGPDGFSIKPRTGIVQYDGTAIESASALLVVTATDRQGKAAEASAAITVSVASGSPVALDEPETPAQIDPTPGLVVAANALASLAEVVVQAAAAQAPAETNSEPWFAGDVAIRTLPENSPAGTLLGEPVTAEDADNDGLTYSLSGGDAFTIDAGGGQISVASGAELDYETQPAYTLTVGVSDGKNAGGQPDASVDDTIQVVVSLTNVDETPPAQQVLQVVDPAPSVSAGPILNAPAGGGVYGAGERITVTLTFSEAVTVSGTPRLGVMIGEQRRWAGYSSAAGASLSFVYEVKAEDRDDDGLSIKRNALRLNGGTIVDGAGRAADLDHPGVAASASHKVDGSPQPVVAEPHGRSDTHTHTGPHTFLGSSGFDFKATPGDRQVKLSWNRPSNRYSTITKYQYLQDGGNGWGAWTDIRSGSHAAGYSVLGLKNGTEYKFKIRTVLNGNEKWVSGEVRATPLSLRISASRQKAMIYQRHDSTVATFTINKLKWVDGKQVPRRTKHDGVTWRVERTGANVKGGFSIKDGTVRYNYWKDYEKGETSWPGGDGSNYHGVYSYDLTVTATYRGETATYTIEICPILPYVVLDIIELELVPAVHPRTGNTYNRLQPVGPSHEQSVVTERTRVSGNKEGVAFLESNNDQVVWTIDAKSQSYGFYLQRLDGVRYVNLGREQVMLVAYDGRVWPEGGDTHTITVTGTIRDGSHSDGSSDTVDITVGLIRK